MSETSSPAGTDTDAPAALPGDGLREGVIDLLRSDIGDGLIDSYLMPQTDLWLRVSAESWFATGTSLKAQGFDYFCFISAIDWMPSPYSKGEDDPTVEKAPLSTEVKQGYAGGETRFQLLARVTDLRRHFGVTIKADVPDSLSMPTWIPLYAGANWHERETHEMFGITFDGHPDMRNLYLPGAFEGFPLRKDFPLLARMVKPWPGIVDVEPMPAVEGADAEVPADPAELAPDPTEPAETDKSGDADGASA